MANNYESGATFVPAECFAPGGAEAAVLINGELQDILYQDDELPKEFDDFFIDGLKLEMCSDGSLYIASGEELFCFESFQYVVNKLAERKLLLQSFSFSVAFYCSKMRADEFGGTYYRAFPNGEVLALGTQLADLPDEQFRHLVDFRQSFSSRLPAPAPAGDTQ